MNSSVNMYLHHEKMSYLLESESFLERGISRLSSLGDKLFNNVNTNRDGAMSTFSLKETSKQYNIGYNCLDRKDYKRSSKQAFLIVLPLSIFSSGFKLSFFFETSSLRFSI